MNKKIFNYIKFIFSLMTMGFGIALVTKSNLGTSAMSSVPFVLSQVFNLSFGTFTIILNLIYFAVQLIVLNKDFPKHQYLQIIIGPILGVFIDLSMFLLKNYNGGNYLLQLTTLLIGCFITAISISIQLDANVVTNPPEGIVKLISSKTKHTFSKTKMSFDIFLVTTATLISLIGLGKVVGVREGTLISAFVVGYFIKLINSTKSKLSTTN